MFVCTYLCGQRWDLTCHRLRSLKKPRVNFPVVSHIFWDKVSVLRLYFNLNDASAAANGSDEIYCDAPALTSLPQVNEFSIYDAFFLLPSVRC